MSDQSRLQKQIAFLSMTALMATVLTVANTPSAHAASPLCFSSGSSVNYEWISRFQLNGVSNNTGRAGYVDLTGDPSPFGSVAAGTNYPVEFDVTTDGGPFDEYVKLWLDLNQDGVIDPTGELLFDQSQAVAADSTTTYAGNVNVPATAFNGNMVGRVIMQYNSAPALCGSYSYGTTLDFNVEVIGAMANPAAPEVPTGVSAVAGNGQATVSFTPPASGPTPTGYTITAEPGGAIVTTTASPVVFPGLTNGTEYTFTVTATIAPLLTGPTSAPSNAVTPKAAPSAPPLPDLTDATNSGSNADTITNIDPAAIVGTAEANSTVEVFVGGISAGTTAANASGDWTFTFGAGDIVDGDNAVTVTATDSSGSTSPLSATLTVTFDGTAATPSGLALTDATNSGSLADTITNVAEAQVSGVAEANSEVEVFVGGVSVGTTMAGGTGAWDFTFAGGVLATGDNIVTAAASDLAGNTSLSSGALTITLDQTLPSAPTGTALTDATNSGSTADTETNIAEAQIEGATEANATVEVFIGGASVGTTTANSSGVWNFTFAPGDLAAGDNAVTVTTADIAGNTSSPASAPLTITLDADNTGPSGLALTDATNSGELSDAVTNIAEAEITGIAEAGAAVEVLIGGVSIGTTTANGSGDWSYTFTSGNLAQGDNAVTTISTDIAGNVSPVSGAFTLTLDGQISAPAGLALADATNSGSTADTETNVAEAQITGTAEPGASVDILVGGVSVGMATANSSGDWSFTFADGDLAQGANSITTVATDIAANVSAASAPLTITLDQSVPASAPAIDISDASNSGSDDDTRTNNATPEIGGTAEPGSTVEVFVGGVSVGTAVTDEFGNWVFTFAGGDLSEGDNVITVAVTDPSGNTSPLSPPQTIGLDTISPDATFTVPAGPQSGPFVASVTFTEPVEGFDVGDFNVPNVAISGMTTTDNMTFTFTVTPEADGEITLALASDAANDTAGNVSAQAPPSVVASDSTAPTVVISGPVTAVTEVFEVAIDFSEPVSGFTAGGIVVTGGTLSNFQGGGQNFTFDITPILGESITVSIAGGMAEDVAGNNNMAAQVFAVQAGSPSSEFQAAEEEIRDAVIGDAQRTLKNRVSAQRKMIEDVRARFIADRRRDGECRSDTGRGGGCSVSVSRNSVPFDITGDLVLRGSEISTRGSFYGQSHNATGDTSRVVSGDFNLTADDDGSVAALISGRVAWESTRTDSALIGYYIGGDLARSNIKGSFDGRSNGFGLSLGSYFVREFSDSVYADGYASLGYGGTDLKLSNETLAMEGEQRGFTFLTGASLTGVYARRRWEIWPQIGLDYGYFDVGDVDFDVQAHGLFDTVSLNAGAVEILQLSIAPEIKVALSGTVEGRDSTTLTLTPRLVCQTVNGTRSVSNCGWGAGIGLNSRFNNGSSNLDAGIQLERIGDRTTSSLQLAFERKF